jgi:hypothetical protein
VLQIQTDFELCAQVRKAFKAEEGKALVVADYGQLELRLLAHMAGCKSMLEAFRLGGDFHSRTALGMYDHIQKAIDRGANLETSAAMQVTWSFAPSRVREVCCCRLSQASSDLLTAALSPCTMLS